MTEEPFKTTHFYHILPPEAPKVPLILSIPHCGTAFPEDIKDLFLPEPFKSLDDTDWFLEKLYEFAPAMGVTTLLAHYHRWVVDLNRDPEQKALYEDGRVITDIVPKTDFLGNPLYEPGKEPTVKEIRQRVEKYFWPYHRQLNEMLEQTLSEFGFVILYDAHSIRTFVPSIQKENFSDFILGDNEGRSASPGLIRKTLDMLQQSGYTFTHNHPFKGGFITRNYGKPERKIYALQMERAKINYMDATESIYDPAKAEKMKSFLKELFTFFIQHRDIK